MARTRRPPTPVEQLQQWFILYVEGDDNAFLQFYARMYALLRHWVRGRVPRDIQEDLIQQFFLKVHQNRHRIDYRRPILPYLRKMFQHIVMDHYRDRTNAQHFVDITLESIGDSEEKILSIELERILAELPAEDRDLIRQHFIEGRTIEEIARRAGVPSGRLRVRKHRLLKRLIMRFRPHASEGGDHART